MEDMPSVIPWASMGMGIVEGEREGWLVKAENGGDSGMSTGDGLALAGDLPPLMKVTYPILSICPQLSQLPYTYTTGDHVPRRRRRRRLLPPIRRPTGLRRRNSTQARPIRTIVRARTQHHNFFLRRNSSLHTLRDKHRG